MRRVLVISKAGDQWRYVRARDLAPFLNTDWLINPDLSAVAGTPEHHWTVVNDAVVLKSQADRDAADLAVKNARMDAQANRLDQESDVYRAAFVELLADRNSQAAAINALRRAILDATNLATLKTAVEAIPAQPENVTPAQFKTRVRNRLDN